MEKYAIIEHEVEMRTKEERRLTMEKKLEFSDEVLDKLTTEELVDLKIEVDDLLARIDNLLEDCEETINS